MLHDDIMTMMPDQWVEDFSWDIPWKNKTDERLLWRGSNTGAFVDRDTRWRESHRIRLVNTTNSMLGNVTILRSALSMNERVGFGESIRAAHANPALMDVSFTEPAIGCAEPTWCEELKRLFDFRHRQGWDTAAKYKYFLDIDGNGWSGRFQRLISTNSLVLKASVFPEWFGDRIMPWVHYVPIQMDFSDLYDALVFFRGDVRGDGAHDDLAERIAAAGAEWSRRFWRREDMVAYMFRLFLEYSRVMSEDRQAMTFTAFDE